MADNAKYLIKPYRRRNFYIPEDVEVHCRAFDCWVSFFHHVYDLSSLLHEHRGDPLCWPIIQAAGSDISHWFDEDSREPKTFIDPVSNLRTVYCPFGRYLHVPPIDPSGLFDTSFKLPWWKNEKYYIGELSRRPRKIRLLNMLSKTDDVITVAAEESLEQILERYLVFNDHAASYTWKMSGRPLDMELTLEENGIDDDSDEFKRLEIDDGLYVPTIHLYYNDDLTVK
jgi:hypothetical protein